MERELDNGLRVIVLPDRRAPVVVSQIWYRVGSSYEHGGITGVSHMLEHMMFKGTEALEPGEFSRVVARNGGSDNAFTGRDYTAYFQKLGNDRLELSFRLESDRMRNLVLSADELAREARVVAEERRLRTEDSGEALTGEQLYATAFNASPYHHPVIGWMSDIESYELADVRAWYERWYRPNNATLVVVGDVEPDAVFDLAEHYFGDLEAAPVKPPKPRLDPPQRGERRVRVSAPGKLPYLAMGYRVPTLSTTAEDWEPYALAVLGGILDAGRSARLPRELVREQRLAVSASASYNPYSRLEDLFVLEAQPVPGVSVESLESALRAQVRKLQEEPLAEAELSRVVAQVLAGEVFQRDSQFYQAMRIGALATVGLDWRLADEFVDRIRSVSAGQVQAVARKYLLDERLTVAILDPEEVTVAKTEAP